MNLWRIGNPEERRAAWSALIDQACAEAGVTIAEDSRASALDIIVARRLKPDLGVAKALLGYVGCPA